MGLCLSMENGKQCDNDHSETNSNDSGNIMAMTAVVKWKTESVRVVTL